MRPASKAKRSWKERPIPTYGESNAKVIMTYLGMSINEVVSRRERGGTQKCLSTKGGFFSESVIRFSNLQKNKIPKNYPELEIQIFLKFFRIFFLEIWRFEKRITLSEKKHL